MSWIPGICWTSHQKRKEIRALRLAKYLHLSNGQTSVVAKLGKVKRTLLFALLLNDEDGNRQIDQEWNPFCRVVLAPLSYVNFYEILISISI